MFIFLFMPPIDCVADFVHVLDAAFGQLGVSHITRWDPNKLGFL